MDDTSPLHILLAHRPELIHAHARAGVDLVFTGHARMGAIQTPFCRGVVAPDQGLFSAYTSGSYTEGDTTEIVSRGLGNNIIPLRIFNRPEIVVVTLNSE